MSLPDDWYVDDGGVPRPKPRKRKTYDLSWIEIDEVSFCSRGANQKAFIVLSKADTPSGVPGRYELAKHGDRHNEKSHGRRGSSGGGSAKPKVPTGTPKGIVTGPGGMKFAAGGDDISHAPGMIRHLNGKHGLDYRQFSYESAGAAHVRAHEKKKDDHLHSHPSFSKEFTMTNEDVSLALQDAVQKANADLGLDPYGAPADRYADAAALSKVFHLDPDVYDSRYGTKIQKSVVPAVLGELAKSHDPKAIAELLDEHPALYDLMAGW
jgi:hypothetical protein